MMKYTYTSLTKIVFGVTLYQIKALVSFGSVVEGEIGGWIEKRENLAECGDAWVYGDARVHGDARVYGDADFLSVGPLGSRKSFLSVYADSKINLRFTTGCFTGSRKEFKEQVEKTHGSNIYGQQYRAAIALAKLVVKPYGESNV